MEYIHRIANIETLALPGWSRGPWADDDTVLLVVQPHGSNRIGRHSRRTRHLGHDPTMRGAEFELTSGRALDAGLKEKLDDLTREYRRGDDSR